MKNVLGLASNYKKKKFKSIHKDQLLPNIGRVYTNKKCTKLEVTYPRKILL